MYFLAIIKFFGEWTNQKLYDTIVSMKTITITNQKCPNCGKETNQIKKGFNPSGTQRYGCKECGKIYTLDPKKHEFDEKTRLLAMKIFYSGVSGRGVGKILGMNKANVYNWIKKTT